MNDIFFNGTALSTFGVVPTGSGIYTSPERDYSAIEVPGRNGDIIIDNGRFKNVTIEYPCYINGDFKTRFGLLKSFLLSNIGYCRLSDTYDTEFYREAYFFASIEPELSDDYSGGKFSLVFNCKPQRFSVAGGTWRTLSVGSVVENPYLYNAKPLYRITASGTENIALFRYHGGTAASDYFVGVDAPVVAGDVLIADAETMTVYYENGSGFPSRFAFLMKVGSDLDIPHDSPVSIYEISNKVSKLEVMTRTYTI